MKRYYGPSLLHCCFPPDLAVPGLKSPVRIGMNPTSWRGRCPAEFRFTATIVSRGAGTVYYHWERSDGSSTPRQSSTFS